MGAHAYALTNKLAGISLVNVAWSTGGASNKGYLSDGRMDKQQLVTASAASGIYLQVDFGSAVALDGVAILNHNAAVQKTDAAVLVQADTSGAFGAPVTAKAASTLYSSIAPRNKDHVLQWATVTKQVWRLTFTWTGNVQNFSLGEIFFFQTPTSLSRRSIYGSGESQEMIVAQSQMQYGETRGLFQAGPIRSLRLNWADLSTSERDQLQAMWAASKAGASPMLWIQSFEATAVAAAVAEQECIYGRLMMPHFEWSENDFSLFTPNAFDLRSLGREAGA